jgi:hypothetical protein
MDPLLILGMTDQDAEDYCRQQGIPYVLIETRDPRFAGCCPTVRKIVKAVPAEGQWLLICASFRLELGI